jgi:quercetin 2,3-dioxygenase
MAYVHATVPAGERLEIPWDPDFNALVYTLAGTGTVGPDAHPIQTGTLAVMGRGSSVMVAAASRPAGDEDHLDVLIIGGQPIREHVEMYGPFVMNTRAELGQAMEDFEAGRLGRIPPNALMPHVPDPAPARTEQTGI